eukprot:480483-Amphidinium_carterae.2
MGASPRLHSILHRKHPQGVNLRVGWEQKAPHLPGQKTKDALRVRLPHLAAKPNKRKKKNALRETTQPSTSQGKEAPTPPLPIWPKLQTARRCYNELLTCLNIKISCRQQPWTTWYGRVPSKSNPADAVSRLKLAEVVASFSTAVVEVPSGLLDG